MDKEARRIYNKKYRLEIVTCPHCKKQVKRGQLSRHKQSRKCKNYGKNNDDKTTGKKSITLSPPAAGSVLPAAPVESKILKEINLNKEFENMSEKFKGGSDAEKEKKYKYKCECGEYFNLPAKNDAGENCCPFCGK